MRIGCPGCKAAYEVPDAQVRPGRMVQCVRCGVRWRPVDPVAEPEPVASVETVRPESILRHHSLASTAIVAAAPAAHTHAGSAIWGIAWGASLCLVIAAGVAFAHFRGVIIHGWPATIRLYDLFDQS